MANKEEGSPARSPAVAQGATEADVDLACGAPGASEADIDMACNDEPSDQAE